MHMSTHSKVNIAAAFMALATSSASAIQPSAGHADAMPAYGPSADKTCSDKFLGTKKPGNWWEFNKALGAKNIVQVMGNECQTHFMSIDPDTLQLKKILSSQETMGLPPAKVLNATPAPEKWWEKSGIIPATPQGEIQISGPPVRQWTCTVKIGAAQIIQASPGALIIPDATRAFLITTRRDPSIQREQIDANSTVEYGTQGKPSCAIEPLITMPSPSSTMTIAGGGIRNPGHITVPAKPVEPATAIPLPFPAVLVTSALMGAIVMLDPEWPEHRKALLAQGAIIYNAGADLLLATKEALGLSDTQLGELSSLASQGEAATLPEAESGIKRGTETPTPLAIELSKRGGPGNCDPNEHKQMEERKNLFCNAPLSGALTCTSAAEPIRNMICARINALCARQREEIMNKCYDGGNAGHKTAAAQAWTSAKRCLELLSK